jgi:hypothetical protein
MLIDNAVALVRWPQTHSMARVKPILAAARHWMSAFALPVALAFLAVGAAKADFDVNCHGVSVGRVEYFGAGADMVAYFDPNRGLQTLAAAAQFCGEDHFNWQQFVVYAVHGGVDSSGNRTGHSFLDPPLGGYSDNPRTPGDDTLWADNEPWYLNEGPPPAAGTTGYEPRFSLANNTLLGGTRLYFEDTPHSPFADQKITFLTLLVSINKDGNLDSYHGGFFWNWKNTNPPISGTVTSFQAIPEPTAWALLILGFGAVGATLRKAKLRAQAV